MAAAATYEPIATTTLTSSQASISFSSLGTYTDLRLVLTFTATSSGGELDLQFNSDTGTNYSNTELYGTGATAASARYTSQSAIYIVGSVGASTTIPSLAIIDIFSYRGSTNKTILATWSSDRNGSGSVGRVVGLWRNTAAITSVLVKLGSGSFASGTTATIYGITAA